MEHVVTMYAVEKRLKIKRFTKPLNEGGGGSNILDEK